MRLFGLIASVVALSGCDPIWRVGVDRDLSAEISADCLQTALQAHPRVLGVKRLFPPSYDVATPENGPAPIDYLFETDLGSAFAAIEGETLQVYFAEIGFDPPPGIAEQGPDLVDSVSQWVMARCLP